MDLIHLLGLVKRKVSKISGRQYSVEIFITGLEVCVWWAGGGDILGD